MPLVTLSQPSSPVKSNGCIPAFYGISKCFKDAFRRLNPHCQTLKIEKKIEGSLEQLHSNSDDHISLIRLLCNEVCSNPNHQKTNEANRSKAWEGLLQLTLSGHERIRECILVEIKKGWKHFTPQQQQDAFTAWQQATDPSRPTNWPALRALHTCWDDFSKEQVDHLIQNWTTHLTPSSIDTLTSMVWNILDEKQKSSITDLFINTSSPDFLTKHIHALGFIFDRLSEAQQLLVIINLTRSENDTLQLINFVLESPIRTRNHLVRMVRGSIKTPYFGRLIQASTELKGEQSVCTLSRFWEKFTKEEQESILLSWLITCPKPLSTSFCETFKSLFFRLDPTQKSNLWGHIIIHFRQSNAPSVMHLVIELVLTGNFFADLTTGQKLTTLQEICCADAPQYTQKIMRLYNHLSSDEKKEFIKLMACLFVSNPATPALERLVSMLINHQEWAELRLWIDYSRGLPYFEKLIDISRRHPSYQTDQSFFERGAGPSQPELLSKWIELAMISPNLTNQMDQIVRLTEASISECPELFQLFNRTIPSGTDESSKNAARVLIAIISTRSSKLIGLFCKWIFQLEEAAKNTLLRWLMWCFKDQKTVLDDWVSKALTSHPHQQNIRDILFSTIPHDDAQSPHILCVILSARQLTLRNELKSQFKEWDDNQVRSVVSQLGHILTNSKYAQIHYDSFDCLIELATSKNQAACSKLINIMENEFGDNQSMETQCIDRLQVRFPTKESLPSGLKDACSKFYT